MRNFIYPARLTPDAEAGGYVVTFRDVRGAVTQGDDLASALTEAQDCLDEAIAGCIARGDEVPLASRPRKGEQLIPLPALMAAKASLYLAMHSSETSNVKLAKLMGCDEKEVRRMLSPRHQTKIARIQEALRLLGKRLLVSLDDAA
jgi:antitoxin HicB